MQPFHQSFKIRQALVSFSPEQVREVLAQRNYADTMSAIDQINKQNRYEKHANGSLLARNVEKRNAA